jgi:hypothetical protein
MPGIEYRILNAIEGFLIFAKDQQYEKILKEFMTAAGNIWIFNVQFS